MTKIEEEEKEEILRKKNEEKENEKVKKILDKWLTVQKTIKEEITLKETINNQKIESQNYLKKKYLDFYQNKLKIRETTDEITSINNLGELFSKKHLIPDDDPEIILQDAYDPIQKLFFIFRDNYNYVFQLFNLIDKENFIKSNEKEVSSLIDLFCHQFYENIIIPNPEHEELLILIFLLLKKEILSMNSSSVSSFLDSKYSIVGKFLKSYIKRQELKSYISTTLGPLILSIEDLGKQIIDLNITTIGSIKYPKNEIENYDNDDILMNEIFNDKLVEKIPKCNIDINKRIDEFILEDEYDDEDDEDDDDDDDEDKEDEEIKNKIKKKKEILKSNNENDIKSDFNEDYKIELNIYNLNKKIENECNQNLKEFYQKQVERLNKNPDIFTNNKFINNLNDYKNNSKLIFCIYKSNFLYILKLIDKIIQSLIDKISTIPYPIRCICKIIYILISKKFPKINKYEKNAFIGEFIFGKCIFPILINSDINAIITSTILSQPTKNCLKIIAKVLSKINKGMFFDSSIENEYTIFNHYIIEVIPIINEFYNRLIDIQFPKSLNQLIEEHMKTPIYSIINDTHMKKNKSIDIKKSLYNDIEIPTYNYFSQNPDELVNIHCVCFSIEDILFLINVLKNNKDYFKDFLKFNFFSKTIDKICPHEEKLKNSLKKDLISKKFFIIYKIQEQENKLFIEENVNYLKEKNINDSNFILKRILFSIKRVLLGLNYLNNKDYPYLNAAKSSKKFFLALKHTLDDYDESVEGKNENGIPLKWYSQYISNNKKMLDKSYKKNDFEQLYNDLYNQEDLILKNLRNLSSIINTRYGLYKRCAEKKIENSQTNLKKMNVIEKYFQIEQFINKTQFEIYFEIKENNTDGPKVEIKELDPLSIKYQNKLQYIEGIIGGINMKSKNSSIPKIKNIKEFILQFRKNDEGKKNIKYYTCEDIKNGDQKNKIYETFNQLFEIIKGYLKNNPIFSYDKENNYSKIIEKIENHIHKKIYNYIFPQIPSKEDEKFYNLTLKLSWITPEHLEIKKMYINELKYAESFIIQMENKKSVHDKIYCISEAYDIINNTIKFSSGKNVAAGADDLAPIFQYIIIKAKPKRFYSNIYYIKCFIRNEQKTGIYGFLLSQMVFSAEFITNINHEKVKMSKEEFENKMKSYITLT